MSGVRIRPATVRDLDVLVLHRRLMWQEIRDFTEAQLDAHDRLHRRWARQRLRSGRLVAWVAETPRGEIAASGAVWLQEIQPHPLLRLGPVPYLLSMYTEPEHRGKGLATRIVREAIRWAKRHGYARMTLHASTQGRDVYKKLGWKRTWEMRVRLTPRRRPARRSRTGHRAR